MKLRNCVSSILIILAMAACFNPLEEKASYITINLGENSGRAAVYPPTAEIKALLVHKIKVAAPDGSTAASVELAAGELKATIKLDAGIYTVTVDAYLEEIHYATGSADAEIEAGISNPVSIKMSQVPVEPEPDSYTVSFDSRGGSGVNAQTITEGGMISRPEDPAYAGHTFDGWFRDAEYTTPWDFERDSVAADITLYARWKENPPNTFTVAFNADGGSPAPEQTAVTSGGTLAKPSPDPAREGYSFGGWYKDENRTEPWIFAGDTSNGAAADTVTADITLYAKWSFIPVKYPVSFFANENREPYHLAVATKTEADRAPTLPSSDFPSNPAKSGYTFDGWFTDATVHTEQNRFTDTSPITGPLNVWAGWTIVVYTVSFESFGGSPVDAKTIAEGEKVTEPDDPVLDGKDFGGWYREAGYTNKWDFDNDTVSANITLYARWMNGNVPASQFTVSFDSVGGSGVNAQTVTEGGKITKPADPTRDGHRFDGWFTEAEYTNQWYFDTNTVTADITLYARWTLVSQNGTFTIDFEQISDDLSDIQGPALKRSGGPIEQTITLSGDYDTGTVKWELYGRVTEEDTLTLSLDPSHPAYNVKYDLAGSHILTLSVEKAGILYGKRVIFTVE